MSTLVAIALLAVGAAVALRWRRREQALERELAAMGERMDELTARLEATEADLASVLSSAGVAESLLLEKGIADEDEVEATRRRLGGEAAAGDDAVH
ncbi:MAG: hypothetical protein NDI82_11305 [Anaeromyxobacteraceae bacterium]|nr:hypothetical protein [Anaeromyxobacteraceae bacterium]